MNILFISQLYPLQENSGKSTPALHYFVREWVKEHTVKVIRPHYYYEKEAIPKHKKVLIDGVEVHAVKPIWFPIIKKSLISQKAILKLIDFQPDVIVCHKNTAYLPFFFLKNHFKVPFVVGIHTTDILFAKKELFKKRQQKVFEHADLFAYRSNSMKKLFLDQFPKLSSTPSFIANSGIPEHIIRKEKSITSTEVKKILYVGTLIGRKHADKVLIALASLSFQFEFTIIGEGGNLEKLKKLAQKLDIQEQVTFKGFIPREDVFQAMDQHDYFVMPSINETFGLVYLEAMARGLIAIGMKNTGVDGIIQDRENGFLCKDASQESINSKIRQVLELTTEEEQAVVNNALETVNNFTDKKVADNYLQNLIDLVDSSN